MPFLPIDSTIVSNPSRGDLAIIESWMLFPDDEAKRLEAYKSATVAMGGDLRRKTKLPPDVIEELFDLAEKTTPIAQIHEMVMTPYREGFMAGAILIDAIEGRDGDGNERKLGDIIKGLTKQFAKGGPNSSSSFVHTIWKRYRPVSHLWAAHIKFAKAFPASPAFPCDLPAIIDFLWLSEEWRLRGESTKTAPTAPSTILRPGDAVRTPEAMKFSKKDCNT